MLTFGFFVVEELLSSGGRDEKKDQVVKIYVGRSSEKRLDF